MNGGAVKENANPKLFLVGKRSQHRVSLDWTKMGNFREDELEGLNYMYAQDCDNDGDDDDGRMRRTLPKMVVPTTAEDKAILKAIMDCSKSTLNGKGVDLLRKAGLVIPAYSSNSVSKSPSSWCYDSSRPVFTIPGTEGEEEEENTQQIAGSTTSIDDEEVKDKEKQINDKNNNNVTCTYDESVVTVEEIFDIIRTIQDPEHPHTLEQLGVVSVEQVEIVSPPTSVNFNKKAEKTRVNIQFTPTIPHCSMATLIGLCLRVKLFRSLPLTTYKVDVMITPGTHVSEKAINKQLRDKERIRAALENKHLANVVDKCIKNGMEAA